MKIKGVNMKKNLIGGLILLLILSMGTITEAMTSVYIGPGFGWWGRIDGRMFFSASLPIWRDYDYRYDYPFGYYYPYNYRNYGRVVVNPVRNSVPNGVKEPEIVEYPSGGRSDTPYVTGKDQDMIFYGGIQIHPAGRIKIITTKGVSGQLEIADIEIDGFTAGKTGIEEKPFEMGLLVGKHKVALRKDGKEVFSTEIDVERNREISLKINLEGLDK